MGSRKQKILAVVLVALVVIGAAAGTAFGYLSATTGPVSNTLTPDQEEKPAITETFDGTVKSNVAVNVGDPGYAVYVRATIVVTWENGSNVAAQKPILDTDYTLSLNVDTPGEDTDDGNAWFYNPDDGFYYHRAMVNTNDSTAVLIESCKQTAVAPAGYQLHVEIIAQTIQALGTTDAGDVPAVTDAWGIRVNENKLLYNTFKIGVDGANLDDIQKKYGVTVEDICAVNPETIKDPDLVYTGYTYYLPNAK